MDKQNEQKIVAQFARIYEDWPKGQLKVSESPDFILKINHRKAIGIELTELKGQDFVNHTGRLIDPSKLFDYLKLSIESKEEKLLLYQKQKLHRIWLLIHVPELRNRISFHLDNKLSNLDFDSGFDRIFLLETRGNNLWELSA